MPEWTILDPKPSDVSVYFCHSCQPADCPSFNKNKSRRLAKHGPPSFGHFSDDITRSATASDEATVPCIRSDDVVTKTPEVTSPSEMETKASHGDDVTLKTHGVDDSRLIPRTKSK